MSSTVATAGDPAIQMHKNTAQSAREAVTELPVVSAVGIRPGHAAILEAALADTRKSLEELARVADVGASGAEALGSRMSRTRGSSEGWMCQSVGGRVSRLPKCGELVGGS